MSSMVGKEASPVVSAGVVCNTDVVNALDSVKLFAVDHLYQVHLASSPPQQTNTYDSTARRVNTT